MRTILICLYVQAQRKPYTKKAKMYKNAIMIIVSKMTSHCADTVQMREESESGIRK